MATGIKSPGTSGSQRTYDASRRRQAAEASRRTILACARELFLQQGFGATTITEIAAASAVSVESIYKNFGGKAGLVRALHAQSLLGTGGLPAEQRSDLAQVRADDPRELMEQFGRFTEEVSPLAAPISLLIRDAAATGDAVMASLLKDVDDARHRRMLHNARQLIGRGLLRPGMSPEEAADIMFACTTPELFETLVLKRGWSAEQYGRFIASTLAANLL